MLTNEERAEIESHLSAYPHKRAACIDALKIVQQHRGWISDESLKDIAAVLDMSPDELDNVATFYNLIFRKPVGKHVILLCDSISCWLMGYEQMYEHIKEKLGIEFGGTTADKDFTLLPMVCLGDCDHAPVMMVDGDHYGSLSSEKIEEILDSYRK